jgi:putative ABC transport system permease protein
MTRSHRTLNDVATSLLVHKQRTALLMLGPAVSAAVLAVVVSTAQGAAARISDLVARHGLDMIMVRAGGEVQVFAPTADRGLKVLVEPDARAIESELGDIEMVSAVQNQRGITVVHGDRSVVTRAFGVEPNWAEIRRRPIGDGEFLSESDMAGMARVAVLGIKVAGALFPEGGAVGSTVRVNNDPYTVKGVFIPLGVDAGGDDWDDRVIVPLTTASRRLFNRPYLEQIVMRVDDASQMPAVAEDVRNLLRVRHSIAPGEPDDFFVREPADIGNAVAEMSASLSWLSIALAAVALVAGGIVMMNVMLAAVTQRSREIGLRRAMGARSSDITRQFLLEALGVTIAGWAAGVVLGVAVATSLAAAGMATSRITWMTFALSLAACLVVSVLFGVHPARKAARINPAFTLRDRIA